jgi:hypothetical protein
MSKKDTTALESKEAIHSFLGDVRDYVGFVNKIAELIRISDGIATEPLDKDITVGDLMLALIRKGEILHLSAEKLHDLANDINIEE